MVDVRPLSAADVPALERFLAARIEESMFLLSNLREAGFGPTEHRLGGVHVGSFVEGELAGVACHLNMGNLMLSAPEHASDLAELAMGCSARSLRALVGPEAQVDAVCERLRLDATSFRFDEREGLYRLHLADLNVPEALAHGEVCGRAPRPADLERLLEESIAYQVESIGKRDSPQLRAEIRAGLPESIARGDIWLLEREGEFVAKTGFNARVPEAVQIGGVWTPPPLRGRGYARCALASHLLAVRELGVRTAILFTGDGNLPAQRAYLALGFERVGRYRVVMMT